MAKLKTQIKFVEWIIQFCKKRKIKQDELTKKKIRIFLDYAEKFYIEVYIIENQKREAIDFHPSLYRKGIVKSSWAAHQAYERVLEIILSGNFERNFNRLAKELKMGL